LINFTSESNCRRCGTELSPKKSNGTKSIRPPGSVLASLFKLVILVFAGAVCYIGYTKYTEESKKVVQQYDRKQAEQQQIKGAYVNTIKNEIKKIPSPKP
jgi:hypothetical protein